MSVIDQIDLEVAELQSKAQSQSIRHIDKTCAVWIFGAGNFGQDLCRAMQKNGAKVCGFIETTPRFSQIMDLPVVSWTELSEQDRQKQIAIGIFNRSTPFDELVGLASAAGFSKIFMPWDTYDQFGHDLGWRFWLSPRDLLLANLGRMPKVLANLSDETSRNILLRLIAFRLGLDLEFAGFQSPEQQYFNEITLPSLMEKSICYVDCGAYNGDTYIDLASRAGISCRQAFLLEPDPANYAALVMNVAGMHAEAVCLPLAAADTYTILSFHSGKGEGGSISCLGDRHIASTALDQMFPRQNVDFVKLDVEGAELQVLSGARQLIRRSRPILAMSLYHNSQDIWELPEVLFELCHFYKFYVRQHYFNSFECVLYAIPELH